MATIRLKFRPSSVTGAVGTLYYQVIHRRSVRTINTGRRIYAEAWDEASGTLRMPLDGEGRLELMQIRMAVDREQSRLWEIIGRLETSGREFTVNDVCDAFYCLPADKTVFAFLTEQVQMKERMQRQGTAKTYTSAFRRFREFRGGRDLSFGELTPYMMEEYEAWLTGRRLRQNTIRFYLRTLNTLLCKAADEGLLSDRNLFSRVHLSYVKTTKRAIPESAIQAIRRLSLSEGSTLAFARDLFLFSFYMRGMPFVDIAFLRKSDLKNGQLSYCRKKTGQYLTIEWEREQQEIVDRYAHLVRSTPYMFPIIRRTDGTEYRQYQRMQENVNRALKKIGRMVGLKMPLTTYVARHSWACVARNMNCSIAIISEGMGHSSYKTTQVYLDSINTSKIDEANRRIIHRISKGK